MKREQWEEVKKRLSWTGGTVNLLVDGYTVTIQRVRSSAMRDAFRVYVNGVFRGKWLLEDCEERRRFFEARTKPLHKPKVREALKKMKLSKKEKARWPCLDPDATFEWHMSRWGSFDAMKRHLIKNNTSIELVSDEAAQDLSGMESTSEAALCG